MPIKTNLSDIFSDLNSESSVILPKSIKIKNIKHLKNLDTISNTTSSFMPQKGGYSDATSSFMPQKGGNFIDSNKDINQLLSMLSATSDDNYTTNSTDTEQLKNKLFNILQDGGSPRKRTGNSDMLMWPPPVAPVASVVPVVSKLRREALIWPPVAPPAPVVSKLRTEALIWPPVAPPADAHAAHTTPTALAPDHQQNFNIYSLKNDTIRLSDYTNDELGLVAYLRTKISYLDILDFSSITRLNNSLLDINKIISGMLVPELKRAGYKKELNLSDNNIAREQQEQIIKFFHLFTSLNLESTNLLDSSIEKIAEALKTNETLITLNISDNKISIENATKLGEALQINTTLRELNLSGTQLKDEGANIIVDSLTKNNTLRSLNLSQNAIKDNTLKNKVANIPLIKFNFDNNFI